MAKFITLPNGYRLFGRYDRAREGIHYLNAPVYIVACGARTPLGLMSEPSASAYRAAVSAAIDHPYMRDRMGDPITCALDGELDADLIGPERLLAIATSALRECCAPLGVNNGAPRMNASMYLGLPEIRPGFTTEDAMTVRTAISKMVGLPINLTEIRMAANGHASGLAGLASAAAAIREGVTNVCLVGGVDSYCHPDTLEWLDTNRQLMGSASRSGFVPGEAAGFCLLMSEQACVNLGMRPLANVLCGRVGREFMLIKTQKLCVGEGLSSVIKSAITDTQDVSFHVDALYCDMNGERYRGEEWGFACLRVAEYLGDPTAYESPADCWGDVGAASGPLFAMLTCQAAVRGYSKGPRSLLWASSEGGLRSAVIVEC